ncbi:MAG: hypothetical protein ACXWBN_15165, partial [Acidimicrobiales bacterium]
MAASDDEHHEMSPHPTPVNPSDHPELDGDVIEQLVMGTLGPDDVSPAHARVASVIAAAASPARPQELHDEHDAVSMFVAERDARSSVGVPMAVLPPPSGRG